MGQRGKLPLPASILQARGSNQHIRRPEPGPQGAAMDPKPPADLKGEALEMWRGLAVALTDDGTLKNTDRNLLTCYCRTHATILELRETLRVEGLIVEGRGGIKKENPACRLLHKAESMLLLMAKELGITPASRSRVQRILPQNVEEHPMAKLVRCVPANGTDK